MAPRQTRGHVPPPEAPDQELHLRAWREKTGYSQQGLADRMNTDKGTVSRHENNRTKRGITRNWQKRWAEALGVPMSALTRHPDDVSLDELVTDVPREVRIEIADMVRRAVALSKRH